jgi:hypothetical protein
VIVVAADNTANRNNEYGWTIAAGGPDCRRARRTSVGLTEPVRSASAIWQAVGQADGTAW